MRCPPAVIIDPTDPGRNAGGAAISLESLSKMKMLSKIFLSSPPSEKFFSMVQPEGEIFGGSRDSTFALFTLPRPDEIDDVIYPQAVRLRNILMGLLSREGFLPIDSEVLVNERVQILVECERGGTLPRIKVHEGPPVDSKNAMDFYAKWKGRRRLRGGPYIRGGNRLYVDVERSEVGLEEVVRNGLRQYNIGAHLNRLRDSLEIIITAEPDSGMEIFRKYLSRQIWP
ncbi:hypothetical protein [Thermogymnomonas acidicola]|uniref:hypothetical protein n=1 Tax=Thermogymnomonas acidicola TaxID=399579 RepID=UPI00139694B5|nr:hypothetical protein [Thermogymnomonas acidicola]